MHCLCQNAQNCCFTLTKSCIPVGHIIGVFIQFRGHFIRKILITASVITTSVVAGPLATTALRSLTGIKACVTGLQACRLKPGKSQAGTLQHLAELTARA